MSEELGKPGQIIDGKYRIVRLLGTGGMGAVYEGENLRIRRRVAIKMLHGSVSSQPDVIARFEREAQAAALVGSEHICEVLDLGELPDTSRYMVMEYLEGETLSQLIKRSGRLRPQQSIPILLQILDALGAAHSAGIVHRDLKPDNVYILPQKSGITNFVKILDFGVSKFSQLGGEQMNVTRAGAVVGTPYYMSPEQARGSSAIDQRTDIYAIGVLLYQATTGQVPYQAETFNELLFKIVLEVAPPPQTYVPDLDPEFAAIILRAMAREPDQRYQTCLQFREALARFQGARANPLPAYALPTFHDDANPLPTQVLGPDHAPRSPQTAPGPFGAYGPAPVAAGGAPPVQPVAGGWPVSPSGSYPAAQPAPVLGASAPGYAPSPMQSGAQWGVSSTAGLPPGAQAVGPTGIVQTANTANSWGNASSPSVATAPPKSNRLLAVVVGLAALVGIGGAVTAVVALGPSGDHATTDSSARPAAPGLPSSEATAAPAKTESAPVVTAPPAVTEAPSATAAPAQTDAPEAAPTPSVARVAGPMPTAVTTSKPTGTKPKPPTKPNGKPNDLGY